MKLKGKVALVTGSSQGIGQAIVLRLAEEGADVVINYRSHPEGAEETLASMCKIRGGEVAYQEEPSAEIDEGSVLICISQPGSSRVVLDI